jgi:hypothetical protein
MAGSRVHGLLPRQAWTVPEIVHIGSPPAEVSILAFWSPDGVMGRAELDPSGNHDNGGQARATGIEPA